MQDMAVAMCLNLRKFDVVSSVSLSFVIPLVDASMFMFLKVIHINNISHVMSADRYSCVSVEQDGSRCRRPMRDHLIVHSTLGVRSIYGHTSHLSLGARKHGAWR
jgi:hypothetical protein